MSGILSIIAFLLFGQTSVVGVDVIKNAVRQYVISRLDSTMRKDAIIEFRGTLEPVSVMGHGYSLRVGQEEEKILRGFVTLPVEIESEGKVQRQLIVSLKVRLFGEALFADRQLERHVTLTDENIGTRYVEMTSMPDDVITSKEDLIGKRTSRIVGAGSVLSESSLELIPLIFRDEPVVLLVRYGHVRLSIKAIAREDGVFGSTIEVQKVDSHERIEAIVIDEHTVQVTAE